MSTDDAILLTGFPSYVARRACREILRTRADARIYLLHALGEKAAAEDFRSQLESPDKERITLLGGDVSYMDLGLPSGQYRGLVEELTEVQHLASRYGAGGLSESLKRVNVNGTREVIELAGQCQRLKRLVHWSTVQVSGSRKGVVLEDELARGQRFRNAYERTRFEAERLVGRAARKLPVTVLRTGIIVGDSTTGELEQYEGPHQLVARFVEARREKPILLPGSGEAPVHLVPIDFVVAAACHLSVDEQAIGRTYHLVDPSPLPAHMVYQLIARKAHRQPTPQSLPTAVSRLLRLSSRIGRLTPFPIVPPEIFDHMVFYNCQNTVAALARTDVRCPPFGQYVEQLVGFVSEASLHHRSKVEEQFVDPLA
ncbi:SDR family oxidoreductase [Myxococcota bacterium]